MPDATQDQDVSALDRYSALKSLRDNVYLRHPNVYHGFGAIEDHPALRQYAPFFGDVVPTQMTLGNSDNRDAEVDAAVQRLKDTRQRSKNHLLGETVHGMWEGAKDSVLPSVLMSAAFRGLSWSPIKAFKKGILGKTLRTGHPLDHPNTALNHPEGLIDHKANNQSAWSLAMPKLDPNLRRKDGLGLFAHHVYGDSLMGIGGGMMLGATSPVLGHFSNYSDKAINEAADILRNNPGLASLPEGDLIQALSYQREQNEKDKHGKLWNAAKFVGAGALGGAATGFLGQLAIPALRYPMALASNKVRSAFSAHPIPAGSWGLTSQQMRRLKHPVSRGELQNWTVGGAALGGLTGALTSAVT